MYDRHKALYARALKEYLSGAGETALKHAYEVGRNAVQNGLGIMDMASIHKNELLSVLSRISTVEECIETVNAEQKLFTECLAPFELTHRGFKEVESANRDLESFSYSVSHDLRAPLRAIDGFSGMLMKDLGGRLNEDETRKLNVVRSNALKMMQLIDGLLEFSRLGRSAMSIVNIEMDKMVRDILNEQLSLDPGRNIECGVGRLPEAAGDRHLIRQVVTNLVSNAVKFTGTRDNPVIQIGGDRNEKECVYYVKDNGVGFDMNYLDKLFGVFQRLHPSSKFEGTGIGLAIVQRIVNRHGGRIWAEGRVDEGATFWFSLPV